MILRQVRSSGMENNQQRRISKAQKMPPARRNPYRATSLVFDDDACDAVKAIGNLRFLDVDGITPNLPLSDCDLTSCNCKYAHHPDRRASDKDRRQPQSSASELYDRAGNIERRQNKHGRRKADRS
jgi:hypothetical protein